MRRDAESSKTSLTLGQEEKEKIPVASSTTLGMLRDKRA